MSLLLGARITRWSAAISALLAAVAAAALVIAGDLSAVVESFILNEAVVAVGFGLVAWAVFPGHSGNATVWALTASSVMASFGVVGAAIAFFLARSSIPGLTMSQLLVSSPSDLPFSAVIALQPTSWLGIPAFTILLTVVLQIFPDGKPLSPAWRWPLWASVALVTAMAFPFGLAALPSSTTPLGSDALPGLLGVVLDALSVAFVVLAILSLASIVVRYRRGSQQTRHQIRWIALAGVVTLGTLLAAGTAGLYLLLLAQAGLVAAFAIAITRYKVYAVDVVISKVVTYGSLAVLIAVLYAVSVFAFIFSFRDPEQASTGELGVALPVGATLIVALAFEPLRQRLQRWANRLVYGRRAAPAEVLSQLAARLGDVTPGGDLESLAGLLREGTAADEAVVWLRVGEGFHAAAASPASAMPESASVDSLAALAQSNVELSVPVVHAGDTLGALQILKPRAHKVTSADRDLLVDVAAAAGLLMRNLHLNAELTERAKELRASRRRLIAAQDAARHRLERDLHDGAQQQVVALKVKLGLARTIAERDGLTSISGHLGSLADETDHAVDEMRRIARGIYPPLLEAEGLSTALRAVQRTFDRPVEVAASELGRYPRQVEETVYFGVVTAVTLLLAGGATRVQVSVVDRDEGLTFAVDSDARQQPDATELIDRVDALGGSIETRTVPEGVQMVASVPAGVEALQETNR